MSETAAHLVDHVFPRVPVRQWVLSLPRTIRYILARDAKLLTGALRIFVAEVFRDLRRRAGIRRVRDGPCGAVTGVQRFGGALNLNIHFHTLVLDGVYVRDTPSATLRFRRLPAPSLDDLDRVLSWARHRILRFLAQKGYAVALPGRARTGAEETPDDPTLLDVVQAASVREWIGLSGQPRRVPVLGKEFDGPVALPDKPSCVESGDGFSLQAAVRIRAGDRDGLERLCRYVLRPPFSEDRLTQQPDGRILYEFRCPRPDGSSHVVLEPVELLEKLAALVPPPRSHLVRYHGVLAPHAKPRGRVVPPQSPETRKSVGCTHDLPAAERGADPNAQRGRGDGSPRGRRRRTPWAELLLRSLGLDVLACPRCSGRMKVISCITEPDVVRKILRAMGLTAEVPSPAPARPPPQAQFEFVQDGRE